MQQVENGSLMLIQEKAERRSPAETLIRVLTNSSFPHAAFSNMVIQLAIGYGNATSVELNTLADSLRDQEKKLGLLDFIRCIEIIKNSSGLRILAKKLDDIDNVKTVTDHSRNHIQIRDLHLDVGTEQLSDEAAKITSEYAMKLFHKAYTVGPNKHKSPSKLQWRIQINDGRNHSTNPMKSFKDLGKRSDSNLITDYDDALTQLMNAFKRERYHILVTPRAIMIRDQNIRLSIPDTSR